MMDYIHKQFDLVFVLLLATTYTATAFLLDGQCIAPPPCFCSRGYIINCAYRQLKDVPQFESATTEGYISTLQIQLNGNHFRSIPANVFLNVSSVNTSSISLSFRGNLINSIDPSAFTGIENKTTYLQLQNNQLSSLPSALGKLSRLESLNLAGNPLVSIDSSVTKKLSLFLTNFRFDMGQFSVSGWPTGLSYLNSLDTLVIRFIPLSHLPFNAFSGLSKLTSLTLSYSKLSGIPDAVCHLQNLQTFNFDHNSALERNSSLIKHCLHNLARLTMMTLRNDSLLSFPNVLQYCPSITHLEMDNNNIGFINTDVIPYNNSLQSLNMRNNSLTRVSFALNKLKQLKLLYLDLNHITTIEDHDLVGLTNLNLLELYHNPIQYIARNAFSNNVHIYYVSLDETQLQLIPEAVSSLPHLSMLGFENNNADCSCKMSYLKGWNATAVRHLFGDCANQQNKTNDGIKQFLLKDLPNCP